MKKQLLAIGMVSFMLLSSGCCGFNSGCCPDTTTVNCCGSNAW